MIWAYYSSVIYNLHFDKLLMLINRKICLKEFVVIIKYVC